MGSLFGAPGVFLASSSSEKTKTIKLSLLHPPTRKKKELNATYRSDKIKGAIDAALHRLHDPLGAGADADLGAGAGGRRGANAALAPGGTGGAVDGGDLDDISVLGILAHHHELPGAPVVGLDAGGAHAGASALAGGGTCAVEEAQEGGTACELGRFAEHD